MSVRAKDICDEMKIASAKGISNLINDDELNEENIVSTVFNEEVCNAVIVDSKIENL